MLKLERRANTEFKANVSIEWPINRDIQSIEKGYEIIEQGRNFTSFLEKVYFNEIFESEDRHLVKHLGQSYETDSQMFNFKFFKEVEATE